MKHPIFHSDWSRRINHLETLKYAVFFVQTASLGYLAIRVGDADFAMWRDEPTAIWWTVFSAVWFAAIGIIQYNLFRRYLECAHQLMVIEHLNEVPAEGLGYYSDRVFKKDDWRSRFGLRISGLFAELMSILWFVVVAITAKTFAFMTVYWLAVSFGLAFATMMVAYNIFHSELLKEKDDVDEAYLGKIEIKESGERDASSPGG